LNWNQTNMSNYAIPAHTAHGTIIQ
jgi:hypothetical protein